jgi:hypothetical protein
MKNKSNSLKEFPMDKLPAGCKHLYGNLFIVPFNLIKTPSVDDDGDGQYHFKNPRLLVERGQADLLDKKLSTELRDSIKNKTLLNPLVCRWVEDGDSFVPTILGGDRRYRCLDYLIRKSEKVVDPRGVSLEEGRWSQSMVPADEAYEYVVCQVFPCNDDLEALALSWAENKCRINLTDGHEIAEVIKLREVDAPDSKILEILQQDQKWLAETDKLISGLDASTLADLLEGRIDRSSAQELAQIDDSVVRDQVREKANEAARESCHKKIERIKKQLAKTMDAEELAEGAVAFAEDEETAQEATEALEKVRADKRTLAKQVEETRPVATAKDVRAAADEVKGAPKKRSAAKKIKQNHLKEAAEYFDNLIRNNGKCPNGQFTAHIDALKLAHRLFTENLLKDNDDWEETLREHYG